MAADTDSKGARRTTQRALRFVGLSAILVLMVGGIALVGAPAVRAGATSTSAVTAKCVPPASTSPSTLRIPDAQPSGRQASFRSGEIIGAQFEIRATQTPSGFQGTTVQLPSVQATFHLTSGSSVTVSFAPQAVKITGQGWTSAISRTTTASSSGTFSSATASLSTNWLAVMAPEPYGALELQFQWRWTLQSSGGGYGWGQGGRGTQTGSWSPAVTSSTTSEQPTSFYPAPLVSRQGTAPVDESPNATYWVNLTGNVSGTSFRFVVETPTGHEVESVCSASTSGASYYNDSAPLEYTNGTPLPAGNYLVHVHNAGGAIVVFAKVTVK
jgi:hypothetical protein